MTESSKAAGPLLLIPTCAKYAPFCGPLIELLEHTWPDRPESWFITDGGEIEHPNVLTTRRGIPWAAMILEGLELLSAQRVMPSHVYIVLEDLLPLHPVDPALTSSVEKVALQHDLAMVVFPSYRIQYRGKQSPKSPGMPACDVLSFKGHKLSDRESVIGGLRLAEMCTSIPWYSQLQPALWKVEHLRASCEAAIANGKGSPWEFEHVCLPGGEPHWVVHCRWPTVWNGLFLHGKVNLPALPYLLGSIHSHLRSKMLGKLYPELPATLADAGTRFVQAVGSSARYRSRCIWNRLAGKPIPWPD